MSWLASADGQQALWTVAIASLAGVPCALLGCFLLLKRMSLLADGISHGVLPGIALGVLLTGQINSVWILIGAMAFGILTALLSESLSSLGNVSEDSSLGVVFTSLFALGVVLISSEALRHTDADTSCVFFGSLESMWRMTMPVETGLGFGVELPDAVPPMGLTLLLTLTMIGLLWKELKLVAFDPGLARAMGFYPVLVSYLLVALVSGATVTAFQAVGSILVLAMLIVPAATAHMLTDRLAPMLAWSALLAVTCSLFGYVLAEVGPWSTNVGGMIAVVAGLQFLAAALVSPRHGWLPRAWRHGQLSLRIAREEILAALYRHDEEGTTAYVLDLKEHGLPAWVVRLAFRQLLYLGLVDHHPDGTPRLTEKGRRLAQSLVRAHRLWEVYAGQVLALPPDHVHAPATRMEHYIGPQLQQELADTLQEPQTDPHGRAVPPP